MLMMLFLSRCLFPGASSCSWPMALEHCGYSRQVHKVRDMTGCLACLLNISKSAKPTHRNATQIKLA